MRGVVTLAAAVSVVASPTQIPAQDTIFVIAFIVTVGTLLLQGLTLPFVIRALKVQDPSEDDMDRRSEMLLNQRTTVAAIELLDRRRPAWAERYGREAVDAVVPRLKSRLERQAETFRQDAEDEESEERMARSASVERRSRTSDASCSTGGARSCSRNARRATSTRRSCAACS